MNASELRIGNLVKSTDANTITEIYSLGINKLDKALAYKKPLPYKPIPLTEQMSKKLEEIDWWIALAYNSDLKCFMAYIKNNSFYIRSLYYIHELQNFYYALSGEELDIKRILAQTNTNDQERRSE